MSRSSLRGAERTVGLGVLRVREGAAAAEGWAALLIEAISMLAAAALTGIAVVIVLDELRGARWRRHLRRRLRWWLAR